MSTTIRAFHKVNEAVESNLIVAEAEVNGKTPADRMTSSLVRFRYLWPPLVDSTAVARFVSLNKIL